MCDPVGVFTGQEKQAGQPLVYFLWTIPVSLAVRRAPCPFDDGKRGASVGASRFPDRSVPASQVLLPSSQQAGVARATQRGSAARTRTRLVGKGSGDTVVEGPRPNAGTRQIPSSNVSRGCEVFPECSTHDPKRMARTQWLLMTPRWLPDPCATNRTEPNRPDRSDWYVRNRTTAGVSWVARFSQKAPAPSRRCPGSGRSSQPPTIQERLRARKTWPAGSGATSRRLLSSLDEVVFGVWPAFFRSE